MDLITVFDKIKYEYLISRGYTHYLKICMHIDESSKRVYYLIPFKSETSAKLYACDVNLMVWDHNVELLDQYAEEVACGYITSCKFFLWNVGIA